jgi:cell division protein FtsQ
MLFQKVGKLFFIVTALTVLLLGTTDWMRGKNAFSLKDVQVEGNRAVPENKLIKSAKIDSSKDLFQQKPGEIAARLKQENPLLKQVHVERHFPGAIRINVKEAKPVAVIYAHGQVLGIDDEGALLVQMDQHYFYDLPIITGIQIESLPKQGYAVSEGFDVVFNFIKECSEDHLYLYNQISEVNYNARSGVVIYLMKNALPVFLGKQRISDKLNYFKMAYPKLVHDAALEQAKYIDLRMDAQVIVSL